MSSRLGSPLGPKSGDGRGFVQWPRSRHHGAGHEPERLAQPGTGVVSAGSAVCLSRVSFFHFFGYVQQTYSRLILDHLLRVYSSSTRSSDAMDVLELLEDAIALDEIQQAAEVRKGLLSPITRCLQAFMTSKLPPLGEAFQPRSC